MGKKTIAREIGCFVQKATKCSITGTAKTCTQVKSAKALYDCPAQISGSEPLRLRDGTETFGYTSRTVVVCPTRTRASHLCCWCKQLSVVVGCFLSKGRREACVNTTLWGLWGCEAVQSTYCTSASTQP